METGLVHAITAIPGKGRLNAQVLQRTQPSQRLEDDDLLYRRGSRIHPGGPVIFRGLGNPRIFGAPCLECCVPDFSNSLSVSFDTGI